MIFFASRASRILGGAMAALAVAGLAACAPAEPSPSPESPSPAPSTQPYDGPIAFVGDELDLLMPTVEQILEVVPDATEVTEPSAVLTQISDGGGVPADPAICDILYSEQSLGAVGARTVSWKTPADPEYGFGIVQVLQFPDEDHAQGRMRQLTQAVEQCASFTKEAPASFDAVIVPDDDGVQALAGTLTDIGSSYEWRAFMAYASLGNVIVQLWQPFTGEQTFDTATAATTLRDRAVQAKADLVDLLTENPPVSDQVVAADAASPWSEWQITPRGVGPIALGVPVTDAIAASGVAATNPPYQYGPWTLTAPEGAGPILLQPTELDETVQSIAVGRGRTLDTASPDGAAMPAAGDVRLDALIAEAAAAFPGGTSVAVVSSGDHFYDVATRDGRLLRFVGDRDVTDPTATIVGIVTEDATLRVQAVFG